MWKEIAQCIRSLVKEVFGGSRGGACKFKGGCAEWHSQGENQEDKISSLYGNRSSTMDEEKVGNKAQYKRVKNEVKMTIM